MTEWGQTEPLGTEVPKGPTVSSSYDRCVWNWRNDDKSGVRLPWVLRSQRGLLYHLLMTDVYGAPGYCGPKIRILEHCWEDRWRTLSPEP
jgi:hypothetical protein